MQREQVSSFKKFDSRRPASQLIFDSEQMRVVLFCLSSGQELSPHTAPAQVVFYGVEGQGRALIGQEEAPLVAGTLVSCPPGVAHGLRAEQELVVLAFIAPRP